MRVCSVTLFAVVLFTAGCRENQKEAVRELEAREASTASAVAKQTRHDFEVEVEDKLSGIRMKLDEMRAKLAAAPPNANQMLVSEYSRQIGQLDEDLQSIRMQFDNLKSGTDEQFIAGKTDVQRRTEDLRLAYMRFVTGSSR
jgi:hypothetical protein